MNILLIPSVAIGLSVVAHCGDLLGSREARFDSPRHFSATPSSDYGKASFQAEITVILKGGGGDGCAFFGLGAGKSDPNNFNEPTIAPALVVRLAPSDFAGGTVTASINGQVSGDPLSIGDGTHRLRLTWDSARKRAWIEFHPGWKSGVTFTPAHVVSLAEVSANFDQQGHLFAGGGAGVTFSDFQVRKATAADLAKLPVSDSFPNDPTARTWLPTSSKLNVAVPEIDAFLTDLGAGLRPLVCWYSGSTLQASRELPNGRLELPGSSWTSTVETREVPGQPEAREVTLQLRLTQGGASAAGLAAALDFSRWNVDNYLLIPAAVYNGNRLRTVARGYNAGLDSADYFRKDLPLTQGELPRLEIKPGKPSKLEVNASNVATPAICVFDRKAKRGMILLAEQAGRDATGDFLRKPDGEIRDNAFAVEESLDRTRATVVISAPGVRERKPEFIGFSPSPDRGMALKAGDAIHLKLRVYSFAAADIPALLEKFMSVRKALTGHTHPRKLVPASQVETWMTQRIDGRFLEQPNAAFYCPENGPWIAFGWIGGWINTFPMLVHGDAKHLERVTKTFDFGLKAQTPTGYFHYAIRNDGNTTFRDPAPDMNLARTSGDTLFWMIKQFQLLKAQGRANAIKPEWESAMKRLADAMVATWEKDGQWGKLIHVKTGDVGEYNTTGGAMIIGGLALASGYFDQPDYLKTAIAAARYYYDRDFVKQGFTTGGCADILQNADSETAAGFMTALMAIHEVTGGKEWLEMSRNLANLTATWTVSHDYELPKTTELGGLGAKLAGVYWASTQNKHGAPGICTSSGDPLFKIYRSTGDTRYAELIRDIIAAHGESIRPGGFTNERLTFCDADSRGSRGGHVTGWNETNGILMAQEIPGIYLRTDIDRCYVFDAVDATVLKRDASGVTLEITNPTPFDAKVSLFAEDAAQAAKPHGHTSFLKWPKVPLKAGASLILTLKPDGSL